MTVKYHINHETGNPGKCTARVQCRFGDTDHYDSPQDARSAYEAKMGDESTNGGTIETYEHTFDAYLAGSPQSVSGAMKTFIDKSFEDLPPGAKVLELGSGFGRDAQYLQEAGYDVTATDAPGVFVDELKHRGLKATKLNALTDGLPRTDAVFANAVLLHFSRDETARVLNKANRAINGKGHLVFTVKEGDGEGWSNEKLDAPRHFTYWQEDELRAAVEKAGFVDVEITKDAAGPAQWLQVHARKPKSMNKSPNAPERLAAADGSLLSNPSYSRRLNEKMIDAKPGSKIMASDGRVFTKVEHNLYGDNSWKVDRETYAYDKIARLDPGKTYNGSHIAGIIARVGGELQE